MDENEVIRCRLDDPEVRHKVAKYIESMSWKEIKKFMPYPDSPEDVFDFEFRLAEVLSSLKSPKPQKTSVIYDETEIGINQLILHACKKVTENK